MIQKEIRSLTGIRGVASLYVAVFHFYQYYALQKPLSFFSTNIFVSSFLKHGYIAVDMFFMLSAFVLTLSAGKFFKDGVTFSSYSFFMKKRWVRLYPAYLITVIFCFIILYNFKHVGVFLVSLTLLNLIVGLPYPAANQWSLGAEWVSYIFYPFFYKISIFYKTIYWSYLLIVFGLIILYINGAKVFHGYNPDFMLSISNGMPALIRCFAGYFMGLGAFNIYKSTSSPILFGNFFAIVISIILIGALFFPKTDIFIVFLSMLLLISISKDSNIIAKVLSSKWIYFLGIISYPLYLVHFPVCVELDNIRRFLNVHLSFANSFIVLFSFYMLSVIFLATIFTYYIEKPLIKALNKFFISS